MRKRQHESGQAMVEFTLILPLFILLLFGLVDFGCYFTHSLSVTSAAREGARAGVIYAYDADFFTKVKTKVTDSAPDLDPAYLVTTVTKTGASGKEDVVVSLDYTAKSLTPVGMMLWGPEYHVKSSCTMKIG